MLNLIVKGSDAIGYSITLKIIKNFTLTEKKQIKSELTGWIGLYVERVSGSNC